MSTPEVDRPRVEQAYRWLLNMVSESEAALRGRQAWGVSLRDAREYVRQAKQLHVDEAKQDTYLMDLELVRQRREEIAANLRRRLADPATTPQCARVQRRAAKMMSKLLDDIEASARTLHEQRLQKPTTY